MREYRIAILPKMGVRYKQILGLISQKSKIFASFPEGEALECCHVRLGGLRPGADFDGGEHRAKLSLVQGMLLGCDLGPVLTAVEVTTGAQPAEPDVATF